MLLQQIPSIIKPKPELEQYQTPVGIASDILLFAHSAGNIVDRKVVDFGCGTGLFSIGASFLGASEVIGIDIDSHCIETAKETAHKLGARVKFMVADVGKVSIKSDTCLMNPPFGAQFSNRGMDRIFLKKAVESAQHIYSLHLAETSSFIHSYIKELGGDILMEREYLFPLPRQFYFHQEKEKTFRVKLFWIES
jgi:putative methylase